MLLGRIHLGTTLALVLVCCASAQAADVPVLGPHGRVTERSYPGIAARSRVRPPAHSQVRQPAPVAVARAASGRTTLSVLRRYRKQSRLGRSRYRRLRAEYKLDRSFARRLTGARAVDMSGVLRTVDVMAARGALRVSRLNPLWLQLRRNREWWSSGPLLASGQRVSFKRSQLIFQYVPGEGLQIHPLANFGTLNYLWRTKSAGDRMRKLLHELLPLAAHRAGGLAWEYYFDFGGGRPPWVSSLAQGTGLEAMARAATRAGEAAEVLPRLRRGVRIFAKRTPAGVRVPIGSVNHYAQYSFAPGLRILNGFVQSLVGLYDFAALADDDGARRLFELGNRRVEAEIGTYDTGAWSLYSRGTSQHESDLNYHEVLIDFLSSLCDRTEAAVTCGAEANFERYLGEDPKVAVLTRRVRAGHTGALRLRLSKISNVNVQLRRGGKLVYSYSSTLAYGTHSLTIKPPKGARSYDVRISATDLAGNTGVFTDTIQIKR